MTRLHISRHGFRIIFFVHGRQAVVIGTTNDNFSILGSPGNVNRKTDNDEFKEGGIVFLARRVQPIP
jgi:hypothetical protein